MNKYTVVKSKLLEQQTKPNLRLYQKLARSKSQAQINRQWRRSSLFDQEESERKGKVERERERSREMRIREEFSRVMTVCWFTSSDFINKNMGHADCVGRREKVWFSGSSWRRVWSRLYLSFLLIYSITSEVNSE